MRLYSRPVPPATTPTQNSPPVLKPNNQGFIHKLQMTTLSHSPGSVRLAMPCSPSYGDEQGNLHAGALAALLDTAGTHASWSLVQRTGSRGSTVGMQLSYPDMCHTDVVAEAHVEQRSEEMFFSLVQVREVSTGHLVAMGNVSYRLLEGH
jgi:acyl-coenzyme A thioesterase PaaI-like protein